MAPKICPLKDHDGILVYWLANCVQLTKLINAQLG